MRSFITIDPILKRPLRWLPLWFLFPAFSSYAFSVFGRMLALGPWDPFEVGGDQWMWIKACFNGLVGLVIGFAIRPRPEYEYRVRRQSAARIASLIAAILLITLDHWRVDESAWKTTFVDRAIENIGYRMAVAHPFVVRDVPVAEGPRLHPALPPMTHVVAVTPSGPLEIASGHGSLRALTWDGVTRSLQLFPPEDAEDPCSEFCTRREVDFLRFPTHDWVAHKGISRGEEWEATVEFETMAQAEEWLQKKQDPTVPLVWTHDGLVVGWSTHVDYKSISVFVYQILIHGSKPDSIPGSSDDRFRITSM